MADIRSYMKEKEKREKKQSGYKQKIIRHKLTAVYRVLLVVAVFAAVLVLAYIQYKRHIYTTYDIITSVSREDAGSSKDIRLGNSILTYSKDGAHCMDLKGNVTWNQTYQIQDVRLAVCNSTVAIGDYNGRNIYVESADKQLHEIITTMPIRDIAVSASGEVTAILADTDVAWINTYDTSGELSYTGQARMDDSGYPVAISLSPGGELLCVSYIYVDAGVLKTNIVFYNFGPVGANNSDLIVSAYTYTDMLIPYVQFLNDSTAFSVGDNRLTIYSGNQKPTEKAQYHFEEEVQAVYYGEGYIGLVFRADDGAPYRLDVYNAAADKVGSYPVDIEYTDIQFTEDSFLAYNETECRIKTFDGIEKFNGTFTKPVRLMLPAAGAYKYLLVTEESIDTIQLR